MKRLLLAVVPSILFLSAGPLQAVELLTNGNLEGGGGIPGWSLMEFPSSGTETFDSASVAGFADATGDGLGLWLKPWAGGGDPPGTLVNAVLSQTVPAVAGEGYSFAGFSRWELNYAGGVTTLDPGSPLGAVPSPTQTEMELAFLNSAGNVIGSPFTLDLRTQQNNFDFWMEHNFDNTFNAGSPLVAPAGTTSIRVSASMLDGAFNVNPQQSAFFDDFSLVAASSGMDVLMNGGLDETNEFPGWDVTEDPMGVDTVNAQSAVWAQNSNTAGSVGAFLHPWANGGLVADPNDAIFSQTVSGIANGDYTYSLWTKFEGNYSGGVDTLDAGSPNGAVPSPTQMTAELTFLSSGGMELGTTTLDLRADRERQTGGSANDGEWYQHVINATSPAGTAQVRVMASMIDGVFNVDPQQSAFFDDFSLMLNSSTVDGDFNNDGFWNCDDINALSTAIASGSTDLSFDMNGDGLINAADITDAGNGWLAVGGANNPAQTGGNPFINGDANLSGAVDGSDFGIWNTNKFSNTSAWCSGDFNASGGVDGSDFGVWNGNKFTSSASVSSVPEPTSVLGLVWMVSLFGVRVIRRPSL